MRVTPIFLHFLKVTKNHADNHRRLARCSYTTPYQIILEPFSKISTLDFRKPRCSAFFDGCSRAIYQNIFGEVYGERGIMAIHHISSLARSHDQAHFNKNGPLVFALLLFSCKNQLKMRWWCFLLLPTSLEERY